MATNSLNLSGVLSETKRVINGHSRHFLALSVLIILPISFSLMVYLSILRSPSSLTHYHQTLFFFSSPPDTQIPTLLPTLFALSLLFLSLCATSSITYSTFHGFYGRPVNFISSIKSILFSFFPLIITHLILGLPFGGFYCALLLLGFQNIYFKIFAFLITAFLSGFLIYLQLEWCLSSVIVVVESQWGLAPLRRSSYLVRGIRSVAFAIMLLFGLLLGSLAVLCSTLVPDLGGISGTWDNWAFFFQTVIYTGFMTILMLYSTSSMDVLFIYSKALHGELMFEEFAHDYISLPFDDGKVPHVA